jgi:hypothetical protein
MKVVQSPVIEKLKGNPDALRTLLLAFRKRNASRKERIQLDGRTYTIRRAPMITGRTLY